MKRSHRPSPAHHRRGSVILIVVGISLLMLTAFVVIIRQIRSEAVQGSLIAAEAQARIMLPAAISFILESGRLGNHQDGEVYGWTDIRDGGVGPRGPRSAGGALPPEPGSGTWPGLGSYYRADMRAWQRPPYAIESNVAPNPVYADPDLVTDYELASNPSGTELYGILRPSQAVSATSENEVPSGDDYWTSGSTPVLTNYGLAFHWGRQWSEVFHRVAVGTEATGLLESQPVSEDFTGFLTGDSTVRPGSANRAWFRIYRERPGDHDGDGAPWFDTVPIAGHGVFIITCGAGATRGYRDWSEVPSSERSQFRNSEDFFDRLRAQERILWYRVEWSATVGGAADGLQRYVHNTSTHPEQGRGPAEAWENLMMQRPYRGMGAKVDPTTWGTENQDLLPPNVLGTIKWIERLEREPTDGSGNPIW